MWVRFSATKIFWGHNSPKSNDNPVDRWKTPEKSFSDTPYGSRIGGLNVVYRITVNIS